MSLTKVSNSMQSSALLSIIDYGAVGNGSKDDTDAIQATIDAAEAAGGGTVLIPAKTFRTTSSLVNKTGVTLQGEGQDSVIFGDGEFKIFQQNDSETRSYMVWKNFKIKGNATGYDVAKESNHGINLNSQTTTHSTVENMWFEDIWGDGLYIRTSYCAARNIYCKNTYRQGVAVTDGDYIIVDGVRGEGIVHSLVDIEPNAGDNINYITVNDVEYYDPLIKAVNIYHSVDTNGVITKMTLTNIVSHGLSVQSVDGLVVSNIQSRNTDTWVSLTLYLCRDATVNGVAITGANGSVNEKLKISSCENMVVSDISIYGGAPIEIDLLNMTNCTISGLNMRNGGNTAVRLRNSDGTTINGINLDGTINNGILLSPTTALTQTIIKGAVINGATIGLSCSGTINDVYIDGDLTGCTTPIDQGSATGIISTGYIDGVRRADAYGFTAAPTSGSWVRGDRVWHKNPSAGGVPGWVCVTSGTPGTWKAMANLAA